MASPYHLSGRSAAHEKSILEGMHTLRAATTVDGSLICCILYSQFMDREDAALYMFYGPPKLMVWESEAGTLITRATW